MATQAQAKKQDSDFEFEFEGKAYQIEDFTFGELEWLEDELGGSLQTIDASSMKAMVRFIYIVKHRDDAAFTLEDAQSYKLRTIMPEPEPDKAEETEKKRPTRASPSA